MKISEILRKKYLSFDANDNFYHSAMKLLNKKQREAPVTRAGKLVGVFSVSDIAGSLVHKDLIGKVVREDLKKARQETVRKHMTKKTLYLAEDADLVSAFLFITHKNPDSIPVVDKKGNLAGVVLAADLKREMLKTLAEGAKIEGEKAAVADVVKPEEDAPAQTAIDGILFYVQKNGSADAIELAKKFKIPVEEVEEYAESLEKHGLLKVEYSLLGKMTLKKI